MDYQRHYDALVSRARVRSIAGYVERHHVLPRCLGGGDEPENIVRLTPEEHFLAHQLLIKIHEGNGKLIFAALAMTRGRPGNKRYGWLRRHFSEQMSAVWLGKSRAPFSAEHRAAIGAARQGKIQGPHSAEHRLKLSEAHKGKTLTPEHRAKLSVAKLGKKRSPYPMYTCPHCGVTGGGGSMKRWHFDNCKAAPE